VERLNFLFWNIGNLYAEFENEIIKVCNNNKIDIIIIAEGNNINGDFIISNGFNEVELKVNNKEKNGLGFSIKIA